MVAVWFTFENIPSVISDSISKRQLSNSASLVASFRMGVKQRTVKRQIYIHYDYTKASPNDVF